MRKNQSLNLNNLDETIAKLERIKQLLEDINRLAKQYRESDFNMPRPEPMPYIPQPPRTPLSDPPWPKYTTIWCTGKADTDGDTGNETLWL